MVNVPMGWRFGKGMLWLGSEIGAAREREERRRRGRRVRFMMFRSRVESQPDSA